MALGYLLLALVPLLAAAYLVWDYRRKAARRDAASADRLNDLLGAIDPVKAQGGAARAQAPVPAQAAMPAPVISTTAAPAAAPYAARERLLTPAQTLLYQLLRAGLPDYAVFARMTLASVLEPGLAASPPARTEHARRLDAHVLDFVISDRQLRPVAVVMLSPGGDASGSRGVVPMWLALAGVRYVEFETTGLPRKDAIRERVLGFAPPEDRAPAPGVAS